MTKVQNYDNLLHIESKIINILETLNISSNKKMSFLLSNFHLFVVVVVVVSVVVAKRDLQIPDITKLHITSDIRYRYSVTRVESHVKNYNPVASEVTFDVSLPRAAFISRFEMRIGNKTYPGDVKEKEAATKQYEAAVERGESAGIVKKKPRESNSFTVTTNVAAKSDVDFTLVYEELLTRRLDKYEQVINISPGQLVFDFLVVVSINESRRLSLVQVPPLRSGNEIEAAEGGVPDGANGALGWKPDVDIERKTETTAVVTWSPSSSAQKSKSSSGISAQFIVAYDVERDSEEGEVLVVDGYFVHFFAPKNLDAVYQHVYFVLDVSGSMYGRKIEQMRQAMLVILGDLREGDTFTIMVFSSNYETWKVKGSFVHPVTPTRISEAKSYIESLKDGGGTNVYGSLSQALTDMDESVPNYVSSASGESYRTKVLIFLTDGQPTQGEIQNTEKIEAAITEKNVGEKVIFYCLGFGDDVDISFLEGLALKNGGFARKIYEASDASLQLIEFYNEISSPLLANLKIEYRNGAVETESLSRTAFKMFYNGSEIVIAGRLSPSLSPPFTIESVINGTKKEDLLSILSIFQPKPQTASGPNYLERLWAYLTIQQKLKEKMAAKNEEEKKKIKDEILKMALDHGFVTPLTAMVVTQPDVKGKLAGGGEATDRPTNDVRKYALAPVGGGAGGRGGGGGGVYRQNMQSFHPSSKNNDDLELYGGGAGGCSVKIQTTTDVAIHFCLILFVVWRFWI